MELKTLRIEDMSDEQINFMVAWHDYGEWTMLADVDMQRADERGRMCYCSNPLIAWPIILRHKISLVYEFGGIACDDKWMAGVEYDPGSYSCGYVEPSFWIRHEDKNPLRAAMIVYLKLMEAAE